MNGSRDISKLSDLKRFCDEFVASLRGDEVILLEGNLGAGKTQCARFLVAALGGGDVCSPTYSLLNRYHTRRGPVDHVDLYRLQNDSDLESTGFWDLFAEPAHIIIIEWADRLAIDRLDPTRTFIRIKLEHSDNQRRLSIL